jgi:hypothetical protein
METKKDTRWVGKMGEQKDRRYMRREEERERVITEKER